MKILYLSDHTPYNNTFIRQDVDFVSKIHDVKYCSFLSDRLKKTSYETKLIQYPFKSIQSKIKWRLENLKLLFNWKNKEFSRKLLNEIKEINPDIIHCQFLYESAKFLQNIKTEIPVIINIRGYGATHKMKNPAYKKWVKEISTYENVYPVYVCKYLRDKLKSQKVNFKNEGIVLYTGVNTKKFKRTNYKKSNTTTFIQVGSFNDKKGHYYTIKAFQKLVSKNEGKYNLVFIGEGKNLKKAKKLVSKINLTESIFFKGNLIHNDIIKELNSSDIFVHHAVTAKNGDKEGIPNAIAEAMSMEMPILSTYHSGIPEIVENGKNGKLCKEKDVETYSHQMQEISKWNFIKENRNKIKSQFEIGSHINKLLNFYNGIS